MKKTIWILNHYAGNTYFDQGGRHYSLAKYLRRMGYAPIVFCSNTKHGDGDTFFGGKELWQEHMAEEIDVPYVFVRSIPYRSNGLKRIANMVNFALNVISTAKKYAQINGKPDVIYASSVHPLTLLAGIHIAKKFNIKCICEIRDLWPESIVEYSNRFSRRNPLIKLLYLGEKWIYRKADSLVFTMENAYQYIIDRKWEKAIPVDKVSYLNNGVDLEVFLENSSLYKVVDSDLEDDSIFKVVYVGSIRKANNLGLLLDGMKLVKDEHVRLLIWGDGDERLDLENRLRNENISNVVFKGRIEKKYIPYVTQKADVNVLHNNPSDIFQYGVSMNKLFDYMAAGKPILVDFNSNANPVVLCGGGIVCEGTPSEIGNTINCLVANSNSDGLEMSSGMSKMVNDYSYESLSKKFAKSIEEI